MITKLLKWFFPPKLLPPPCPRTVRDPYSVQDSYFKILDRVG